MNSRRDFIKTAGFLSIGFSLAGTGAFACTFSAAQELPGSLRRHPAIDAWLQVLAEGRVRIFTGKLELGQGIRTAVAQVAAEELDLGMEQVEVVLAETGRTPDEGYTAGSDSIEGSAMSVRYAAAAARQKLLELAASRLDVPAEQLKTSRGKVSAGKDRTLTFAELLDGKQLREEIRLPVPLKPKSEHRLVGKPVPRADIARMARGEPVYVQDLRFPGMVHARMVRPPAYRATLLEIDEERLKQEVPGLLKVVVNGSFLGVIAGEEYLAVRAQRFLQEHTRWSGPGEPLPQGQALPDYLKKLPRESEDVEHEGETIGGTEDVSLKASYFKPYIMHGSIGPSCAVALYDKEKLSIWTHSQGVYPLKDTLQKLLDLPGENIHIKGVPGSGCYGHNGADDVAADAALLAMAYPGRHIRLQWSREDEHGWEPYGSAMIMEAAARLDAAGKISHWQYDLWSDNHSTRPGGNPENLLAARYLETPLPEPAGGYRGGAYRNAGPYYSIPNRHIHAHFFRGPLRISALRSLGAYANIFAIESFMDELAEKAGKDPFEFRLMHQEDERARAVIRQLQDLVQGQETAPGSGTGMAFSRYKNSASYCAVAALVTADIPAGNVQVQKMWAVIDAGEVINLDGIKNQTEGGLIQAASWTLMEEVQFDRQHITSRDWGSYPVFRFSQVPETAVVVIDRPEERPLGAGEAAQGPAAAAIANALYRASGKRIRRLPILKSI